MIENVCTLTYCTYILANLGDVFTEISVWVIMLYIDATFSPIDEAVILLAAPCITTDMVIQIENPPIDYTWYTEINN